MLNAYEMTAKVGECFGIFANGQKAYYVFVGGGPESLYYTNDGTWESGGPKYFTTRGVAEHTAEVHNKRRDTVDRIDALEDRIRVLEISREKLTNIAESQTVLIGKLVTELSQDRYFTKTNIDRLFKAVNGLRALFFGRT